MDFLYDGIALGVDIFILGLCVKEYVDYKKTIALLKTAPQLPIDKDLKNFVANQKGKKVPYAAVRGTVTPIGVPIRSVMSPSVSGVLHVIKLSEHRVARGFAGFWSEEQKLIHVSTNGIPFKLTNNGEGVEVVDALSAAVLDMDLVYDNYEPSTLSLFDHVFGFFSGIRQKGFQTTEEVLRDGSFITAIGELELDGKTLLVQPSPQSPLILTTATKSTLVKKFEEAKNSILFKIFICGSISAVLVSLIVRKIYLKKKQKRDQRIIKEKLEKERKERRAKSRPNNLTINELCVVCKMNPKEVIILPCGHICICEDCSEKILMTCPVCRGKISTKAVAFIV